MKIKKIVSMLFALTMVTGCMASFTSCGGDEEKTGSSSTASNNSSNADESKDDGNSEEKTDGNDFGGATLKVLTHRTDRIEDGSLKEVTKEFEEKYNCKVEYQGFTDYASDVSTMMSTDDYGDVLMIPDTVKVKDLGTYFEPLGTYEEMDAKYNWANQKMYDDTVYGVAIGGSIAGGLCYNKATWEEAGITTLPKTEEEFIECLEKIRDNTDAIPYYTNFKDTWALAQWTSLVNSASGNSNYTNELLAEKKDVFAEDSAHYKVFKLMYDVFSDPTLIEVDPNTTDWEGSKAAIGSGTIATMCMGSWAVTQFQEVAETNGDDPANIGYMPCPISVNGVQYAESAPDYNMGINIHSKQKDLGKLYIEWYVEDSNIAYNEGYVQTVKGSEMPEYLEAFENVELFVSDAAPEDLVGVWDQIDQESEVGFYLQDSANFKVRLCEAAFRGEGDEGFKKIADEINKKWNATRDSVLG